MDGTKAFKTLRGSTKIGNSNTKEKLSENNLNAIILGIFLKSNMLLYDAKNQMKRVNLLSVRNTSTDGQ